MPAYNEAKTLKMTYLELPHDVIDLVLLVDDGSSDETVRSPASWIWKSSCTIEITAMMGTRRPAT